MLEFAAAVFFLIVRPGPGVLSTAGVGSGFGYRPGLAYVTGLWAGVTLRRLDLAGSIQRTINMVMATSMLVVVGLAVHSQH